jgi:hypothetical protein
VQLAQQSQQQNDNAENASLDELYSENIFYYSERRLRKLYHDENLHASAVALLVSLLLTPSRGTFYFK